MSTPDKPEDDKNIRSRRRAITGIAAGTVAVATGVSLVASKLHTDRETENRKRFILEEFEKDGVIDENTLRLFRQDPPGKVGYEKRENLGLIASSVFKNEPMTWDNFDHVLGRKIRGEERKERETLAIRLDGDEVTFVSARRPDSKELKTAEGENLPIGDASLILYTKSPILKMILEPGAFTKGIHAENTQIEVHAEKTGLKGADSLAIQNIVASSVMNGKAKVELYLSRQQLKHMVASDFYDVIKKHMITSVIPFTSRRGRLASPKPRMTTSHLKLALDGADVAPLLLEAYKTPAEEEKYALDWLIVQGEKLGFKKEQIETLNDNKPVSQEQSEAFKKEQTRRQKSWEEWQAKSAETRHSELIKMLTPPAPQGRGK